MSKILVAYFSASGVTQAVAETLSKAASADLYQIKPKVAYTSADLDWTNNKSRSSIEMNDSTFRPPMAENALNIAQYDTIFIGFPVWWYVAPTIINTFIETYDLTNKTIIPFATSGSSGIENCEKNLQKQYPQLHWKKGKLLNGKQKEEMLSDWLKQLNL